MSELKIQTSLLRNSCYMPGVTQLTCKPVVSPTGSPIRLRQHGTFFFFLTKMWLSEPHFRQKDLISSALPETKFPSGS
jgi:hypothetical protein